MQDAFRALRCFAGQPAFRCPQPRIPHYERPYTGARLKKSSPKRPDRIRKFSKRQYGFSNFVRHNPMLAETVDKQSSKW